MKRWKSMWLFTKKGFFSVICDRDNKDKVLVRARNKKDIENALILINEYDKNAVIKETPYNDYRFRIHTSKSVYANIVANLIDEMDYSNFKNSVHGEFLRDVAYGEVWNTMRHWQEKH